MAEKSLKVQFRQRRAKASYWEAHKTEVTPGAGEIIVYLPDETQTDISFKIGDGSKNLSELPMFVKVSGGPAGATFIPTVSSEGVISWSNNGGLSNPTAVNIKGPTGETGPKGEQGAKGDKGETGATGNGIETIIKTSTSGLVDTYTITFTSGNTTTFTVTNGQNGSDATVTWSTF